jgi:hypothetical protein
MECEKVRDRFSSLLEGELTPLEEKAVREHFASCSECTKDFKKFEKTVRWLHSVEEAKVPEGFLSETHKKLEERKRMGLKAGKIRPGWFNTLVQLKLPVQAVAMVAIVFLVLYLTKMMPVETPHLKDSGGIEAPLSMEQKKASLAAKPPQEIVLRISNPEKVLSQLHGLVKQFGGEIIKEEGHILLASLPVASFAEFEKEIGGLSSSKKTEQVVTQKKATEGFRPSPGVKRREVEEKDKELARSRADRESHIAVRILLIQE